MDQEEVWCQEQRRVVVDYLRGQGLSHGEVGEWPAWDFHPYVSIFAVESIERPGYVGWWAIAGDLPTDYATCGPERHPRAALRDFSARWAKAADAMAEGRAPEGFIIGPQSEWPQLSILLAARAKLLLQLVEEETLWEE